MVYDNKAIDMIQTDFVLNIKLQCVPFVCFMYYGAKSIAPFVLSKLSDPCHQNSSYIYLECGGS